MSEVISPARGQQRRERRRSAMIAAARSLFLQRGYDAVTLGEIVRYSGGSLSTFYDLFENKAGILGAIVAEERFEGGDRLDTILARGWPPAETLHAVAASLQHDMTRPDIIGLLRIVMAESLRDAAFAQSIYDNVHRPQVNRLAAMFAGWAAQGQARVPDPTIAAHFFLGLILHAVQTRALCGAADAADEPGRYLSEAVGLIITGYAIAAEPGMPAA